MTSSLSLTNELAHVASIYFFEHALNRLRGQQHVPIPASAIQVVGNIPHLHVTSSHEGWQVHVRVTLRLNNGVVLGTVQLKKCIQHDKDYLKMRSKNSKVPDLYHMAYTPE